MTDLNKIRQCLKTSLNHTAERIENEPYLNFLNFVNFFTVSGGLMGTHSQNR